MPFALDHVTIIFYPYTTFYGTPADAARVVDAIGLAVEEIHDADEAIIIDGDGLTRLRADGPPPIRAAAEKLLSAGARNGGRASALLTLIVHLNP